MGAALEWALRSANWHIAALNLMLTLDPAARRES
jgi:uncharacterized membrane protein